MFTTVIHSFLDANVESGAVNCDRVSNQRAGRYSLLEPFASTFTSFTTLVAAANGGMRFQSALRYIRML